MRIFLVPGIAILGVFLATPAPADECDRLPAPSVTVKRLDDAVTVDTHYGFRQLTHLGSDLARGGQKVLGLSRGKTAVRFSVETLLRVDRSGRWECASPQITVTYGLNPITVYVAKEFPEGTCAYDEIFRHEMRHVGAYRQHLAAIEKTVHDSLLDRFVTGKPWRGPVGQTRARLQRELKERWLPFVEREINRGEAAQKKIDSPAEYDRIANSCNGEVRRLTRR